jgi:hypothetical protein
MFALLSGCGSGGGGSGGSSGGGGSSVATSTPQDTPTSLSTSTALVDNPAPKTASFENFDVATVPSLPLDQYTFSGQHTFVKLSRMDGELLFLGEVDPTRPYDLAVHLATGDDGLLYEIFTESSLDETIFGEVLL